MGSLLEDKQNRDPQPLFKEIMQQQQNRELLLRRLYFLMDESGINPIKTIRFLASMPWLLKDFFRFAMRLKSLERGKKRAHSLVFSPFVHDKHLQSGNQRSLYFLQDIYCSQYCLRNPPGKHIDIGSRVDGFVAQIAATRQIEVLDIRESSSIIPNITFTQGDITAPPSKLFGIYDTVTSLHALEHVGLGRYGDEIEPAGLEISLANIRRLARDSGMMMVSLPISSYPREIIEFNAQRIMSSATVIQRLHEAFGRDLLTWWCLADSRRVVRKGIDEKTLIIELETFSGVGFLAASWTKNGAPA